MLAHWRRSSRRATGVNQARSAVAFVTSMVMALGSPALAQRATSVRPLNDTAVVRLGDLYRQVQTVNPRIAAARALAQAALARVPGATKPPDPQLQLGWMNYSLPNLAPMPVTGMAQLQLMQMVPIGGTLGLAGRAASARASASSDRASDVGWDLRTETAMSFYDLYAADQSLSVARETLRLLQDIEKTAESMYRVGQGHQADVLRAQVEIAKMEEDTLRMQAMRESMVAKLNALLDRPAESAVATPLLPSFPDSIPERTNLEKVAVAGRPMIRAGLDDVRAAEASEKLARKEIWPDLQVGVQYAQQGSDMGAGTEHMGSLMIGASIPLFARDRQLRMRDEAAAMKQMAQADVAAMRADTRGKIG